jgi:hypothetical protein
VRFRFFFATPVNIDKEMERLELERNRITFRTQVIFLLDILE